MAEPTDVKTREVLPGFHIVYLPLPMKPTIVNALFGSALLGGLAFGRPLLGYVFDSVFHLDDEGWRIDDLAQQRHRDGMLLTHPAQHLEVTLGNRRSRPGHHGATHPML